MERGRIVFSISDIRIGVKIICHIGIDSSCCRVIDDVSPGIISYDSQCYADENYGPKILASHPAKGASGVAMRK